MRHVASGALASLTIVASAPASADRVQATIVRIEGGDVFVDLGGDDARSGAELEVYRAIEVRHPVTHRLLRDRFVIGRIRLVQPGETVSIAQLVLDPARPLAVGDRVEMERGPPPAKRPAAAQPPPIVPPAPIAAAGPAAAAPGPDPEAAAVLQAFRATWGRTPEERARIWESFVAEHPGSPYARDLGAEIVTLRALDTPHPPPSAAELRSKRVRAGRRGGALHRAHFGQPVELALAATPWAKVRAFEMHVRDPEGGPYRTLPMPLDERGHARAKVPDDLVRPEGFAYFVEAVPEEGDPVAVVGEEATPELADVYVPATEDPKKRSRVRTSSEFVNFHQAELDDWYFLAEADFLYRIDGPLRGVRVGYGVYRGEGGRLAEIDPADPDADEHHSRPAGFTYGYTELDLGAHRWFGITPRFTAGLGRPEDPAEQGHGLRGGFEIRLRIGAAEGTRLVLAGETVPEVGERAYAGLVWRTIDRFPMGGEVHVTDQPANSDELAIRLVYEAGWEVTDWATISGRASYQGRRIDHAGFGGGLAATFDW